jgi:hypothetical protein
MPTDPTFSAQLLGQTEKALNAFLDRLLAGTGLTEPQWVTLRLAVISGGATDREQLVARVADALKVPGEEAQARVAELVAAELLEAPDTEPPRALITEAGRQLHDRVRAATAELTDRLWGDLPADDLATAGRVLGTVLERADTDMASA